VKISLGMNPALASVADMSAWPPRTTARPNKTSPILPKHEVALYEAAFGIPKTVSDNLLSCVNLLVSTPPWSVWTWTSGALAPAATGMARKSSKCKILQIPALQIPSYSKARSSDGGIQDRPLKELELQVISTSCFGGIQ
jgi:hypothetical protein